jgi:hypothetical protein
MKMLVPLMMEPMIRVMVAVAKAVVQLVMVMKIFLIKMLVNKAARCHWVVVFGL